MSYQGKAYLVEAQQYGGSKGGVGSSQYPVSKCFPQAFYAPTIVGPARDRGVGSVGPRREGGDGDGGKEVLEVLFSWVVGR